MERQTIFNTLETIVKHRSGLRSAIPADARFREDLEIDSLLVVDIVVDIEKKFGVTLPDSELSQLSTLGGATLLVDRLVSESAAIAHMGHVGQERPSARQLDFGGDLA